MPDNRTIPLATSDVSITTVEVTIKTLRVGKKQMTQAIFKQLPEELLINPYPLGLAGVVWGHVRYLCDEPKYRHFVFQKGGTLSRCKLKIRPSVEFYDGALPPGAQWIRNREAKLLQAYFCAQALAGNPSKEGIDRQAVALSGFVAKTRLDLPREFGWLYVTKKDIKRDRGDSEDHVYVMGVAQGFIRGNNCWDEVLKRQEVARQEVRELLTKIWTDKPPTLDQLDAELKLLRARWDKFCEQWDELMDQLESVEQLFIAV